MPTRPKGGFTEAIEEPRPYEDDPCLHRNAFFTRALAELTDANQRSHEDYQRGSV